ncbi:MAG: type II secretion system protein [Oceanicoccus sp.]
MNRHQGFTLIELIAVIVLLGILAVIALPRFVNLQSDARASVVAGTGAAFKAAISLAHVKWLAGGHEGPVDNLDLYGTGTNLMDMNTAGWPAQSWFPFEANPQLNNTADCMSVWRAALDANSPTVATNTTEDFQVTYSANTCTYTFVEEAGVSIFYNSSNGEVIVDATL